MVPEGFDIAVRCVAQGEGSDSSAGTAGREETEENRRDKSDVPVHSRRLSMDVQETRWLNFQISDGRLIASCCMGVSGNAVGIGGRGIVVIGVSDRSNVCSLQISPTLREWCATLALPCGTRHRKRGGDETDTGQRSNTGKRSSQSAIPVLARLRDPMNL